MGVVRRPEKKPMTHDIEEIIDEGVNSQLQNLAIQALLKKAEEITLDKLAELRDSDRYGPVVRQVSLQKMIDVYVTENNLVEGSEPKAEVVSAPRRKKGGRKASSRKNGTASAGGGGGSAPPGKKVNFRDEEAKQQYAAHVEATIQERGGEPVSTTELTDICGGSSNQARGILQGLVDEGKVVSTGQARATRYYWKAGAPAEVIAEFEAQVPNQA